MQKVSRSAVLTLAHQLAKTANLSFSSAQKQAWKACKLKAALQTGAVEFSFKKESDGSERKAVGTLSASLFSYTSKGGERKENGLVVKFFDLEKMAFRCFKIENLLSVAA